MWRKRLCARSSVSRRLAWLGAVPALAGGAPSPALAQSSREANPERPTFATHAYAVAPGYAELEQGLAARGTGSLRDATSWDVNLKVGVSRHVQVGLFGPLYARTSAGTGVGDLGVALKLRTDLSPRAAVAVVTSVTAPTGSEAQGLGAGRALGGLVGVVSADLPGVHVDVNAGPQGIGAGVPQWFVSLGGSRTFARAGLAVELFEFTPGGAGSRLAGVLGAVTIRVAEWVVVDAGGAAGATDGTPDQLFVGLTTNLGRLF
jgi:hypothetical protein